MQKWSNYLTSEPVHNILNNNIEFNDPVNCISRNTCKSSYTIWIVDESVDSSVIKSWRYFINEEISIEPLISSLISENRCLLTIRILPKLQRRKHYSISWLQSVWVQLFVSIKFAHNLQNQELHISMHNRRTPNVSSLMTCCTLYTHHQSIYQHNQFTSSSSQMLLV